MTAATKTAGSPLTDGDASKRLAALSATVQELRVENDAFAAQLASDLEELTFLRTIVDRLGETAAGDELREFARRTLPVLNETVRARCLAFLRLPDPDKPLEPEVSLRVGPRRLEDPILVELVHRFGALALRGPLVRNWNAGGASSAWDAPVKGVASMVLVPMQSGPKLLGWLLAINRQSADETPWTSPWQLASNEFGSGEATLISATATVLAMHAANLEMLREKEQILVSVVRSLVSAIEAKDPYTCGHSERVALYARAIARQAGYSEEAADRLYLAALLHDVGKIGVSDAVLKKEGRLTDEEYREISKHPDEGWAILGDLQQLRYVLPGVLHHHERWDGAGYPDGLAGDAIPLDGRVIAVADAFDAMTSDRPYRKGMENPRAEQILRGGAGTQWDPYCVESFFYCLEEIHEIQAQYQARLRPRRVPESSPRELVHQVDAP